MTRRFPNIEKLIVAILLRDLDDELADETRPATQYRPDGKVYHVGDDEDAPPDLVSILPYVRVTTTGGPQVNAWLDSASVDIDVWDSVATGDAEALAERIRGHLRARLGVAGMGILDSVTVTDRPHAVPWADDNVSRYLLTLQVSARRTGG